MHRREEPPISGTRGAGTIFFGGCQARCSYCQNFWLSQQGNGLRVGPERLAEMMLSLQRKGCHNIDLVTPTHFVPQILKALVIAADKGLRIPMVYNCAGYEHLHTLKLLDGVVDIYLPDAKYADNRNALRTSKMHHYVEFNRAALKEMYRQVGGLVAGRRRHRRARADRAPPGDAERPRGHQSRCLHWLADELGPISV